MRWKPFLWGIALCVGLLPGCASQRAIRQAQDAFGQAKQAGAETKAPYNYYAAEAYLGLAEYELGEVDPFGAETFAEQSKAHSEKAIQKAGGGGK